MRQAGQVELREAQAALKDEERAQKMYQEACDTVVRGVLCCVYDDLCRSRWLRMTYSIVGE